MSARKIKFHSRMAQIHARRLQYHIERMTMLAAKNQVDGTIKLLNDLLKDETDPARRTAILERLNEIDKVKKRQAEFIDTQQN